VLACADVAFTVTLAITGAGLAVAVSPTRSMDHVGHLALMCLAVALAFFVPDAAVMRRPPSVVYAGMALVCFAVFAAALWAYRRPVGETLGEWPIHVMDRMRAVGPGMKQMPRTGPVLVISNHPSYLDPCWVMICLPRDLTPLMYAEYYRIPGLHFYMKHVIGAIPSGATGFRREAPELDEVVRRLDRGEGVLIFPEGWVRRTEEEPLRRFAQGAWRILRDRPATPVVACWIEGGWGSWASFQGGPPFKGKRPDFRRPIDIGVAAPVVLDAETLADQRRTREVLRQMVLDARRHLGMPPIE
jgi:1-acyl-sn-glycerol-3-phosphate acyltransferase